MGIDIAKQYHEITKHSPITLYSSSHYLDWENKPSPFKFYLNLDQIGLPSIFDFPSDNAIKCLTDDNNNFINQKIDTKILSQILFFSAGITRKVKLQGSTYYMRAASATGALYPIEIYVVCKKIGNIDAGVYHFCPGSFMLTKLRGGDFLKELFLATGNNKNVTQAPVVLIFTSIAWRNSWKYQARSYRHWFWDCGVIIANYLALCNSNLFTTEIVLGFQDEVINKLLCLEDKKEAAIVLAPLAIDLANNNEDIGSPESISSLRYELKPISKYQENYYSEIWDIHEASYLKDQSEISKWVNTMTNDTIIHRLHNKQERRIPSQIDETEDNLGNVILQRGSTRKFARKAITLLQLYNILYLATINIPFDFQKKHTLIDIYLIANSVVNLKSGSYYYNRISGKLETLNLGNYRHISEHLCLDQKLFGDASVVFFSNGKLRTGFTKARK